jgi:hypothetical protein
MSVLAVEEIQKMACMSKAFGMAMIQFVSGTHKRAIKVGREL